MGTSTMRQRLSTAWMESSVSISKPGDSTGIIFANTLENAR
jgi:hypothetical protein